MYRQQKVFFINYCNTAEDYNKMYIDWGYIKNIYFSKQKNNNIVVLEGAFGEINRRLENEIFFTQKDVVKYLNQLKKEKVII